MKTLERYTDKATALECYTKIQGNGIDIELYQYHDNGVQVYELRGLPEEVERARELLATQNSYEQNSDNYMSELSDIELEEIIVEESQYASVVVENAKKLLISRYPHFDFASLETKKDQEIGKHRQGEQVSLLQIITGYALALLGGLFGFAMGWFIETGKTRGLDGQKYYSYDENSRWHGRIMKWIGLIVLVVNVALKCFRVI
uniref:hypothetical protein n=2 Tax=Roseivirga sp. TaxID=1964215 RepID=UPI00404859DA